MKLFASSFYKFSVVSLDEVKYFFLARIRLLHGEHVMVSANGSSQSQLLISEQGSAEEETSGNTIDKATSSEEEPVKVVGVPVLLEEHSLLDDSLLLSGVEAATIDDGQLHVGSGRIAM